MKIQYFPETDMLSIRLNSNPSIESEEIAPDVVIDYDEAGGVMENESFTRISPFCPPCLCGRY